MIRATPAISNGPSNGICQSLGFTLVGQLEVDFADRLLQCNHWQIDPVTDPYFRLSPVSPP
jgi:hypothetical protein